MRLHHRVRQSFGQAGHPAADTKGGQAGIRFSDTVVVVSYLWNTAKERRQNLDPDPMDVSSLMVMSYFLDAWSQACFFGQALF